MAFLHASKSGYFPFCLEEATEGQYGPGTDRPFEMSLEDAMTLYWKYRTFKVTGSITCSFSGTGSFGEFYSYEFSATGTGNLIDNEQAKMSDLVCNSIFTLTFGIEIINESPLPSDPIAISNLAQDTISYSMRAGSSVKKTPTNQQQEIKIYPIVALSADAEIDATEGSNFFFIRSQPTNPDPFFYSVTPFSDLFQIKINGTIYKAPMYVLHRSFLSGSASGFLLIEGVDERLTE